MLNLSELQQVFFEKQKKYTPNQSIITFERLSQEAINQNFKSLTGNDKFINYAKQNGLCFQENIPGPIVAATGKLSYKVIAIDASQLYPSRHESQLRVGLIKTAAVIFDYTRENSSTFEKIIEQHLYFPQDIFQKFGKDIILSDSLFDSIRQLEELKLAIKLAKKNDSNNTIILLDGSLNLVFLKSLNEKIALIFLKEYLEIITGLINLSAEVYSYISSPSSNFVCQTIRSFQCGSSFFSKKKCVGGCGELICAELAFQNDSQYFSKTLAKNSCSPIMKEVYAEIDINDEASQNFLYFSNNFETVRIDFLQKNKINGNEKNYCINVINDQVAKGFGYPLALLEAHVSADISELEKDFFLNLINPEKIISQKLIGKKNIFY